MKNRVIRSIASSIPKEIEAYSNEDMVIFKPRFFIVGENQFDCYHFTMPRVPMPKLTVDDREITVYANSIFPTNPGQRLKVLEVGSESPVFSEVKYVSIFIDKEKLWEISETIYKKKGLSFRNVNNPMEYSLTKALREFAYEYVNKQSGYEFILDSIVTQIAVTLLRQLDNDAVCESKRKVDNCRNEIKQAVDYLWENKSMKFSLKDMCGIVNLSQYHFLRLFKEETGQTPYEYYMEIKVDRALQFLKERRYSVTEVSHMLGFSSHSHFTSIFRKKMGLTPSEYIKMNR